MQRFKRELIHGNSQIQSICALCGEIIVASVSEGLPRFENEHQRTCLASTLEPHVISEALHDGDEDCAEHRRRRR